MLVGIVVYHAACSQWESPASMWQFCDLRPTEPWATRRRVRQRPGPSFIGNMSLIDTDLTPALFVRESAFAAPTPEPTASCTHWSPHMRALTHDLVGPSHRICQMASHSPPGQAGAAKQPKFDTKKKEKKKKKETIM